MTDSAELRFEWEWLPAPTVRAAELQATWARLEIYAGGECVTLVEDRESRSARRGIFCSLYPLAEWIAFHWWLLQAHSRVAAAWPFDSPTRTARLEHRDRQRHNLRGAGDGFIWPNLVVIPQGATTQLIWQADPPSADAPIRFLSSGQVYIDSATTAIRLSQLVESVLARLDEIGVRDTPLAKEWDEVVATPPDEEAFCRAAARLGLDPYAEAGGQAAAILHASEVLSPDVFDDFMDAVDPRRVEAGLEWVKQASRDLEQLTTPADAALTSLAPAAIGIAESPAMPPWEAGWEQARRTRAALAIDRTEACPIEDLISSTTRPHSDRGLQAFGGSQTGSGPSVVAGRQSTDTSKRFVLARAAWHVVSRQAQRFLVTSAYTDRQKVERAYAAELLAPAQGIADYLGNDLAAAGLDEVESAADHFSVSPMIIQHQIENQLPPAR